MASLERPQRTNLMNGRRTLINPDLLHATSISTLSTWGTMISLNPLVTPPYLDASGLYRETLCDTCSIIAGTRRGLFSIDSIHPLFNDDELLLQEVREVAFFEKRKIAENLIRRRKAITEMRLRDRRKLRFKVAATASV